MRVLLIQSMKGVGTREFNPPIDFVHTIVLATLLVFLMDNNNNINKNNRGWLSLAATLLGV